MKYKFVLPLAFVSLLAGCAKKDATVKPPEAEEANTETTSTEQIDNNINNKKLSSEAEQALKTYTGKGSPTALFFYADWCPACRAFKPTLEEVETKYPNIKVIRMNVDEQKDITKVLNISSIPTLFFFDKDGKFVESTTGGLANEKLQEEFNKINVEGAPIAPKAEKPAIAPKAEEKPKAEKK